MPLNVSNSFQFHKMLFRGGLLFIRTVHVLLLWLPNIVYSHCSCGPLMVGLGLYSMQIAQRCRAMGHFMFHKHLFITNVGISITLSGFGDILQQHYEILKGSEEKWNPVRTFHMSVSGMTIGIICHHTYKLMDHFFPGRTFSTVMKKVLVDQLVTSPVLITVFFATMACLKRSNLETFLNDLKYKGVELYIADWVVWPPAQIINFYFLPTRFRVLYDNTISLGYDVYTSYVTHKQRPNENK